MHRSGCCSLGLAFFAPASDLADAFDGGVDMGFGIEGTDGEAHGTVDRHESELFVNERCAVESGASGYVVIDVEHSSDVTGFESLDVHGDGGEMVLEAVAAIEFDAIDGAEPVDEFLCENHFAGVRLLDAVLSSQS